MKDEVETLGSMDNRQSAAASRMIAFYRQMLFIRLFEERAIELYKEGLVGGSYHPCIGQEAVAVGVCGALRSDDYMTNTYRGRGQHIAKGADPKRLYAEILGRSGGYCKGKGGPMHIADIEHGILGTNGIVGGGIPIAVGAALTAKMSKTDRVSVTFFGDGAVNQGVFYESANLAAVWELPILFICENNLYSEMTPIHETVKNVDLTERAAAVGMPAAIVDGNDPEAVYQAARDAVDRARRGGGPTFIEAKTYRLLGHMYGDSETYRTKEEVKSWWEKEPIVRLRQSMLEFGVATDHELQVMQEDLYAEVLAAAEYARQSPETASEEMATDIW